MSTPTVYPDSDGQPIAENTLQFHWIVTIKNWLDCLFLNRSNVFVAGDLLWYPVKGDPSTRTAPDALVAFGRPKGHRGSYKQWEEGGVAPQVVFEVLAPGDRSEEMQRKHDFYERFGVEEYYIHAPEDNELRGWCLVGGRFVEIEGVVGWTSPRLGVRFEIVADMLRFIRPDGRPFLTYQELYQEYRFERQQAGAEPFLAESERQRAESERQRADTEQQRADTERQRADRLAERLKALGGDPDRDG